MLNWLRKLWSGNDAGIKEQAPSDALFTRPATWNLVRLLERHQVRYVLVGGYTLKNGLALPLERRRASLIVSSQPNTSGAGFNTTAFSGGRSRTSEKGKPWLENSSALTLPPGRVRPEPPYSRASLFSNSR